MCVFEFTGSTCGPKHSHRDQDEWIYILEGELNFVVGEEKFQATRGETVFLPRNVAHAWAASGNLPAWNFSKYVIGKDGRVVAFFPSKVTPDAPELRAAIESALK